MIETMTMYFTVIFPNTMISFWNISTASAPIQNTAARVKYWINSDMMVQPASVSVRSSPTRTKSSMKNMAILSCVWNLLASRTRSFLNKSAMYSHVNWSTFLDCTISYNLPHLNATIVMMVSNSPTIEIMEPAIVKASRARLSWRPSVRALISCRTELAFVT